MSEQTESRPWETYPVWRSLSTTNMDFNSAERNQKNREKINEVLQYRTWDIYKIRLNMFTCKILWHAILILEGLHYQNLGVGRQLSDHVPCICVEMEHSTKIYLHHCYQWHDCSLGNPSSMLLQSIPLSGDAPTSCQPWPATKGTYWSWVTSKCKGEFEDSQTK